MSRYANPFLGECKASSPLPWAPALRKSVVTVAPIILSIETATLAGSVCIAQGEKILSRIEGDRKSSHSNTLLRDINGVLESSNLVLQELDLFAVAVGPGSFTGLRIGLATVKALALTLKKSCLGIPTLTAIALASGPSDATVAVLPAGRGEVYVQLFSVSADGGSEPLDDPAHLPPAAMIEKYGALANLKWTGDGANTHRQQIREAAALRGFAFSEPPDAAARGWMLVAGDCSLAEAISALALRRFQNGEYDSVEALRALYVRPADAKLSEQCL